MNRQTLKKKMQGRPNPWIEFKKKMTWFGIFVGLANGIPLVFWAGAKLMQVSNGRLTWELLLSGPPAGAGRFLARAVGRDQKEMEKTDKQKQQKQQHLKYLK